MTDRLPIYLNDHLAGARFAVDLLNRLQDTFVDKPLGKFAAELLVQIEEDRAVLQGIVSRVDGGGSTLKEAAAWVAEKASRLKLQLAADKDLGVFEALEALTLGIIRKRALWRALELVAETDVRLQGVDFNSLGRRAQEQYDNTESRRLEAARTALRQTELSGNR
jgi:hypothetical protein